MNMFVVVEGLSLNIFNQFTFPSDTFNPSQNFETPPKENRPNCLRHFFPPLAHLGPSGKSGGVGRIQWCFFLQKADSTTTHINIRVQPLEGYIFLE